MVAGSLINITLINISPVKLPQALFMKVTSPTKQPMLLVIPLIIIMRN